MEWEKGNGMHRRRGGSPRSHHADDAGGRGGDIAEHKR